jgi:hypothetical protein
MNQAEKQFIFKYDQQLFADEGATDNQDTDQNIGADFAKASWEEKAQMLRNELDKEENTDEDQTTNEEENDNIDDSEQRENDSEGTDEKEVNEPKHKIKVGGEEKELPLSEIIKLAQQGEDYTKKTQAVSQERKELDEMKAKLEMLTAQTAPKVDPLVEANREVEAFRQEFARITGQEFNEYDISHQSIFLEYKQAGAYQRQAQQQIQQTTDYVRQQVKADPQILQDFDTAMYGLLSKDDGRAEFDKVYQAKSRVMHGNPSIDDLQLVDQFYIKSQAVKQAVVTNTKPKVMPQEKQTPPKVEKAGAFESEDSKPTFNKKAWASGSQDDQKSMLRKLREGGQI